MKSILGFVIRLAPPFNQTPRQCVTSAKNKKQLIAAITVRGTVSTWRYLRSIVSQPAAFFIFTLNNFKTRKSQQFRLDQIENQARKQCKKSRNVQN